MNLFKKWFRNHTDVKVPQVLCVVCDRWFEVKQGKKYVDKNGKPKCPTCYMREYRSKKRK